MQFGFNSQPREGGWKSGSDLDYPSKGFQLAAARRRLATGWRRCAKLQKFQLAAARRRLDCAQILRRCADDVSTRSRAKAAGHFKGGGTVTSFVSTRSRAKAAGRVWMKSPSNMQFQLAAARRRLVYLFLQLGHLVIVSTRSRAKAAGLRPRHAREAVAVSTRSRAKAAGSIHTRA